LDRKIPQILSLDRIQYQGLMSSHQLVQAFPVPRLRLPKQSGLEGVPRPDSRFCLVFIVYLRFFHLRYTYCGTIFLPNLLGLFWGLIEISAPTSFNLSTIYFTFGGKSCRLSLWK
jgi:hypothetical protein